MTLQKHVATLMLLLSCAAAQNSSGPATVQNVTAAPIGDDVRIEVTLSAAVKLSAGRAVHPDRILVDFSNTICSGTRQKVEVNSNGVLRVRTGQRSSSPPITRMVLDLDRAHEYTLKAEGRRVILTVSATVAARGSRRAPATAASGPIIGIFRRRQERAVLSPAENSETTALSVPLPTASDPDASSKSGVAALASALPTAPVPQSHQVPASAQDSAAHASLSEAGVGTQPETPGLRAPEAGFSSPAGLNTLAATESAVSTVNHSAAASIVSSSPTPATEFSANSALITSSADPNLHTVYKVKYVAEGVAYLDGGSAAGLKEGIKLEIRDDTLPARQGDSVNSADPRVVAELEIGAVAETSSVADIHRPKRPVKVGDLAYLSSTDAEALVQQRTLSATRQYAAVISFTEGDTLDEEARQEVPRPPLPSVNRARGRIGFDYIDTISHGTTSMTSSDVGMVFRGDITRIGGTYWNLGGYWRGRLTKTSAASQQTLQNLINRTYHLSMTYDNPNSDLVAGFGRLYLPWAPSLDTIDGGYFGKRLSKGATLGIFGGSTPDPSSWDYNPSRVIGGAFLNFYGGDFNALHYSSTAGAGVSLLRWQVDRPFVFFEDSVSYGPRFAVYESAQVDDPKGNSATPGAGVGLGRSFFTLRVKPFSRLELDLNHTYFRDIPTFDPTLIGTGLLDKFLFQGFTVGGRLEVMKQLWLSTNLGRSSRTGDKSSSLNEMFGLTIGRVPWLKLRTDAHYSRFNSSFGSGSYESVSVSRQLSERLRLELLAGQQNFSSTVTTNSRGRFVTGTVETTIGPHYYLQGSFTRDRGQLSYDQLMFSLGYRFDSRKHRE